MIRAKKNRPPVGADRPVNTKNIDNAVFGDVDPNVLRRLDQDTIMYRKGYADGLRDGLAQGPAHPAVQESVARMFPNWPGTNGMRGGNRRD